MAGDAEFVLLTMWLLQARQVSGWRLDLRARSTLARLLTDALDMDVKSCDTTRDGIGISTLPFTFAFGRLRMWGLTSCRPGCCTHLRVWDPCNDEWLACGPLNLQTTSECVSRNLQTLRLACAASEVEL